MKPLVKWSGGKTKEIEIFSKYYPHNFDVFVEPFVGGGAVFFSEVRGFNIISDVHKDLINFYRQIKDNKGIDIYNLMNKHPNNEETYYYVRDRFKPENCVEEAFKFFYLRKTCFRGMIRYNSEGKFNIPFGRYKKIEYESLLNNEYNELFSGTTIHDYSYEKIFEEYNNDNYFFFLDPPYDSVFTDYGYCKFGKEEHIKLAELFKNTKSRCMIVIGRTDFIHNLYKDYIKFSYEKDYAFKIHSGRIGKEINNKHLIITNY